MAIPIILYRMAWHEPGTTPLTQAEFVMSCPNQFKLCGKWGHCIPQIILLFWGWCRWAVPSAVLHFFLRLCLYMSHHSAVQTPNTDVIASKPPSHHGWNWSYPSGNPAPLSLPCNVSSKAPHPSSVSNEKEHSEETMHRSFFSPGLICWKSSYNDHCYKPQWLGKCS